MTGRDVGDALILLPSMSYSEGVLAAVPYARCFGERSLSELCALRTPDVGVTLINAEAIDPWIVDQALASLSAGDARLRRDMQRRLRCIAPRATGHASLAAAVLADPQVMADLHDTVRAARSGLLVNFAASAATDELGRQLGIGVEEGPVELADRWGTKAGSKIVFLESAVPCPRGDVDVVHSVTDATRCAQRLADADPELERVMIKLDAVEWASGIGNAVIGCRTLRRTGDLQRSVERLLQPWDAYRRALEDGGAIVEAYVAGAGCWPSAQGYVRRDGEFELLAIHDQILVEGEYLGCVFPVAQDTASDIANATARIGVALARRGFHGSFGVDFIVADGCIHATEINLRKIGPSHVIKTVRALAGDGAPPDTHGIMGLPVAYVHRRLHHPELFKGLTPRLATAALDRAGIAYDRHSKTGTILHIAGGLRRCGFVETTSIAATLDSARLLDEQAEAVLLVAARDRVAAARPGDPAAR